MSMTAEDIKLRIVAENAADKAIQKFSNSIRHADREVGNLSKGLKALGGLAVGAFAVQGIRKFNDFLGDSIKLAQIQQDAEVKLTTALGYRSQALIDQAAALQQVTTYGDEAIIEAQALIAAFVKEESQIKAATEATLDLAAAKKMSLTGAADLVSKTLGSTTNALSRYGVTVEGAVGSSERLSTMISEIDAKFGGQAESRIDTYSGKVDQLSNKYGDLKEQVGFAVMESDAFDAALDALNPIVDEFTTYIVENKDEIGEFAVGIVGMAEGAARGAISIGQQLAPAVDVLATSLGKVVDLVDAVPGGWPALMGAALGSRFGPWGAAIGAIALPAAGEFMRHYGGWGDLLKDVYGDSTSSDGGLGYMGNLMKEIEVTAQRVKGVKTDTAAERARNKEKAKYLELVKQTIEWYEKEYEEIDGLYDARKKLETQERNLQLLYKEAIIGKEEYVAKLKQARFELEMFIAKSNGNIIANNEGLFGSSLSDFHQSKDRTIDAADQITEAISGIGVAFETMTGGGIRGLNSLDAAIRSFSDTAKKNNDLQGILYAANFVGANVGGDFGGTLSNVASFASAGMQIGSLFPGGGAIGAAIGGVVGLVSSIFGGGGDDDKQYEQSRRNAYDFILQSALSGGPLALGLMQEGGWSYQGVKNMQDSGVLEEQFGLYWEDRFLADHKDAHSVHMQELIGAVDGAYKTINDVVQTSLSRQIGQTEAYYEYLKGASSTLAESERARMAALINAVTGISADSVAEGMYQSILNYSGYDSAGDAFADKMVEAAKQAIVSMTISNLVNSMMTSVLEPLFAGVTEQLIAGTLTGSEMEALISGVEAAANSLAPAVDVLSDVLIESGVIADSTADDIDGLNGSLNNLSAAAAQQQNLLLQYYRMIEDSAAIREIELGSVYEGNVDLQQALWRVTDAREAADQAYQTAKQVAGREHSEAKNAALDAYNDAADRINDQLTGVRESITELATYTGVLESAMSSMQSQRPLTMLDYTTARQYIRQSLTIAQTLGFGSVDKDDLDEALRVVAEPSTNLYAEYVDYARDFYRTAIDIENLNDLADDQLSTDEQTLKTLEDQLDTLRETYNDEIERLDALYEAQVAQIDELAGINATNISIVGAIEALRAAFNELTEAEQEAARQAAEAQADEDSGDAGDGATGGLTPPDSGLSWDDLVAIRDANVQEYVNSPDDVVTQMYRAFQGREPDAAGKEYWQNQIVGGMPVSEVISRWINSPEFAADISSSPDPVAELYHRIMLRPPDADGYAYWTSQYESGTSIAQIAAAMVGSSEYDTHIRQVRGFAAGGDHVGGWRVVGERGPELEYTGRSVIRSSQQAQGDLGISELKEEIRALRAALNAQTEKIEEYYDSWERKGLPTTDAA